jgi:hypothetical protein
MWTTTFPWDVRGFYMIHVNSLLSKVDLLPLVNTPLPCHEDLVKRKEKKQTTQGIYIMTIVKFSLATRYKCN